MELTFLFIGSDVLDVLGLLNLLSSDYRRLLEFLTLTQRLHCLGSVKLPFETLQRSINVLTILNWNNQHSWAPPFICSLKCEFRFGLQIYKEFIIN